MLESTGLVITMMAMATSKLTARDHRQGPCLGKSATIRAWKLDWVSLRDLVKVIFLFSVSQLGIVVGSKTLRQLRSEMCNSHGNSEGSKLGKM